MLKRRTIRVVVSYSKTQYYVLKGVQYGISYEAGKIILEQKVATTPEAMK